MPQQAAARLRDTKCSRTRSGGRFRTARVARAIPPAPLAPNLSNPLTISGIARPFPRSWRGRAPRYGEVRHRDARHPTTRRPCGGRRSAPRTRGHAACWFPV